MWSKTSPSLPNRFAIFALFILTTNDVISLFFFINDSQKRLSIFIFMYILAFWVTSFLFVSYIFLKFNFAIKIPRVITLYYFHFNLVSLCFLAFFILVACIIMSPLSRIRATQSLGLVIIFSIRYISILYTIFFRLCFLTFFAKVLLLSFTIILFYLL